MKKTTSITLFGAALLIFSFASFAQGTGYLDNRFYIDLGAFVTSVNTTASINSELYGRGNTLDLEKNVGLKDNPAIFRLDAGWRMTPRQQLVFSWYQINRNSTKTLESDVSWGDYTLLAGTGAQLTWDSSFFQVYYRYSFVQTEKGEFGGSIGISYLQQDASLEGWGVMRHLGSSTVAYRESDASLNAPIPVIGVFGTYQFTPKLLLKGDIMYLKVDVNDVNGAYTDARLSLAYYPWEKVGFNLGWYYDKYDVEASKGNFDGEFTYNFNGPVAAVSFRF